MMSPTAVAPQAITVLIGGRTIHRPIAAEPIAPAAMAVRVLLFLSISFSCSAIAMLARGSDQLSHICEVAGYSRRRSHGWRQQMGSRTRTLAAYEIAV